MDGALAAGSTSHERFDQTDSLGRPSHLRRLVLVPGRCGEPATGQVSHCRDGRHEARSGGQRRGCALGRTRPPHADISRALGGDPGGSRLPPAAEGPSLLELCRELAYRMLGHCNFCPWDCRVDRVAGTRFGACKLAAGSRVSSYFHHTGEELFYRGSEGSGTIFFTSCNMRCAFCQNGDISTDKDNGEETDPRTLAAMAWTLRREGCHNINWVGGEVVIHLHSIVDAIALLGRDYTPTQAELARARKTKADRFFWFDEVPDAAPL